MRFFERRERSEEPKRQLTPHDAEYYSQPVISTRWSLGCLATAGVGLAALTWVLAGTPGEDIRNALIKLGNMPGPTQRNGNGERSESPVWEPVNPLLPSDR